MEMQRCLAIRGVQPATTSFGEFGFATAGASTQMLHKNMNPHDDAIEIITSRGFYAERRDWAPGTTVIVSRGIKPMVETGALDGMIILVWKDGAWDIEAPISIPGVVRECGYPTEEACKRAIEYLSTPEDQLRAAFREALKGAYGPSLEYTFPEGMSLQL
jgi:hypothetical protein